MGWEGLFLELIPLLLGLLRRGPEDLLAALRGVVRIWAQVSAPGCRLASSTCRHPSGEV